MLNNLMCEHVKNGKRVLPLKMSSRPGEDLKLNEALAQSIASSKFAAILPRTSGVYAAKGERDVQAPNRQCRPGIPATHNQKPRRQI